MAAYDSIDPYPEPKPAQFPFHVDIRPDRQWDVVNSFSKTFQKKLKEMTGPSSRIPAKQDLTAEQKYADIKALQQMAGIATGLKFLSRNQKIGIEFTDSKDNFERIKESDHLFKKDLLNMQPIDRITTDGKSHIIDSQREGFEGEKNTFYHNANLYQALDNRNPIKKGDKKNYAAFESDEVYSPITSGFLTPLQKLQSPTRNIWKKMNTVMSQITEKNGTYNFSSLEDPYINNSVDTYDMNLDYHHLVHSPAVYNKMNSEEIFYATMSAFEDASRYRGAMQSIFGDLGQVKGGFLKAPGNTVANAVTELAATTETDITDEKSTVSDDSSSSPLASVTEEEKDSQSEGADANAKHWWSLVAENLQNSAKLIDSSLFPALANSMNSATDWSQIDPLVKEKFVEGYFSHLNTMVLPQYQDQPILSLGDLNLDNLANAKKVWDALLKKGYIGEDGTLASKVIKNPDSVELDFSNQENSRIKGILRTISEGRHNFESMDKAIVNGQHRRNQAIYDPYDGTYKTLSDITALLGKGKTGDTQLENSKHAYHLMLDIYANMTGANTAEGSTGEVKGIENADHSFTVMVGKHGSWQEVTNPLGSKTTENPEDWSSVTDQPLSITFSSKGEAQDYVDRLAQMTQWTLPVLGMFSQDQLFILNTNSLTTDDQSIHTEGSAQYREHLSEMLRFTDSRFDAAKEFVRSSSNRAIGQRMFQKNVVNQLLVKNWRKKSDDYDEKKKSMKMSK